ncbi:MAG: PQQ-dependent sugar dehydrogenase [Halobacteriales archaeon]|nr:PQQ-dependent sugar dehydrogenase [Halobacteriales archaeon]
MPRVAVLIVLACLALPTAALAVNVPGSQTVNGLPPFVPEVALGYAASVISAIPAPTGLAFGPGGPDLYATDLVGDVWRVPLVWTPAGPVVAGPPSMPATGFSSPQGLVATDGALFVSDSHPGAENARTDGRVTRVDSDGTKTVVVDGIPNGRHNTNHLRVGPDGRMYIANGNPNDNGRDGGDADVFPYSGALLSVDAQEVSARPAVLHWRDDAGNAIPADQVAGHARNADFTSKVHVLAHGFRNVYGIAFDSAGRAYTGMNGADDPSSQDAFFTVAPGSDYGFPFCYNVGVPGAVGEGVSVAPNPVVFPDHDCSGTPAASALLGWHVCATGIDIAPASFGRFGGSAFVGECGPFYQDDVNKILDDPMHATYDLGHKVARVALDADGTPTSVTDFMLNVLPTDVLFGPDGAMYVADGAVVWRVAALPVQP